MIDCRGGGRRSQEGTWNQKGTHKRGHRADTQSGGPLLRFVSYVLATCWGQRPAQSSFKALQTTHSYAALYTLQGRQGFGQACRKIAEEGKCGKRKPRKEGMYLFFLSKLASNHNLCEN